MDLGRVPAPEQSMLAEKTLPVQHEPNGIVILDLSGQ